jgi:2-iminobutanoate/2-iminopropanoate deaminase
MKNIIATDKAPAAIGPYSQAIAVNGMLYTSGQLPVDPATGTMPDSIEEQTEQALKNVMAILEAAGLGAKNIVKTTVFIKNMQDFSKINAVYEKFFTEGYPARSCVEVARLPKDAQIEIEAVAAVNI